RALEQRVRRKCGQRGLLRWFPDTGIATDQGECGVPRPDGDREVEGRDDAGDAARMPGLDHAVFGAFGGDSQAIELARQSDGEVANVDHLLNLAEAFGDDLADLDGHETAKCFLVHPQLLSEQAE